MNKTLKYALLTLGIAGCCAGVSYGVARATVQQASHSSADAAFVAPGEMNDYGFLQSDYKLTSGRTVGNAPDLVPAAEMAVKAVVHIKVEGEQSMDYVDPFEFFFGGGGFDRPQSRKVTSFGSGVIISTDGYIITNNHVVEGSNNMSVSLEDGRSFDAKLIGTDPNTDIALLKIDADNLPTIPFGDSDKIHLGEWVLAVGNPFNLTGTVTAGIVSAKARTTVSGDGRGNEKMASFIQTDAAVNSGNSGGALVDAEGKLIGINTMIFSQTGNYSGYSFAVPINTAAKVVSDIKKYGNVQRAVLGIVGGSVTDELRKEKGLKTTQGVYVTDFAEVSAAYAAGIEKGDVITAVNGEPTNDMGQLQAMIGRHRPGDKISVTVDRKGTKKEYRVELKNAEGNTKIVKSTPNELLGAALKPVSDKELRSLGISAGLEVTKVGSGKMKEAGIKEGFIILSINNQRVSSVSSAKKIIERAKAGVFGDKAAVIKGFYPKSNGTKYYVIDLN